MIMRKFSLWLGFVIVAVIAILGFGLWFLFQKPPVSVQPKIHFYEDPTRDLSEISLKVFYFVPVNRKDKIFPDWFSIVKQALEEMLSFHRSQFSNLSVLRYEIYPQPVIGFEDNFFYDGLSEGDAGTSHGNPNALKMAREELEKRILEPEGDLYKDDFARKKKEVYQVLAIVYEGVGDVGTEGSLLFARGYLTEERAKDYGPSIFYHELMHTFGVPDFYESEDIMGKGRYQPLQTTHISDEIKKKMGLE